MIENILARKLIANEQRISALETDVEALTFICMALSSTLEAVLGSERFDRRLASQLTSEAHRLATRVDRRIKKSPGVRGD